MRSVTYNGRTHQFPDDATDNEISDALEEADRPQNPNIEFAGGRSDARAPQTIDANGQELRAPRVVTRVRTQSGRDLDVATNDRQQAARGARRYDLEHGGGTRTERTILDAAENWDRGVASLRNGFFLNYGPEVAGANQGIVEGGRRLLRGQNPVEGFREGFDRGRDNDRRLLAGAHPAARLVNEVAGGIISGTGLTNEVRKRAITALPQGARALPETVRQVGRGADYVANAVQGAIVGSNIGENADDRASNASITTALSIPLTRFGHLIGDAVSKFGRGAQGRIDPKLLAQREVAMDAARSHARATAEAAAQQQRLSAEAMQEAITRADREASDRVSAIFSPTIGPGQRAQALSDLAESFGIRLSRSQAENDWEGQMFVQEAATGLHGGGAQRQARPFLQAQNEQIPAAVRGIAGDQTAMDVPTAVGRMRQGMQARAGASDNAQEQAWQAFHDWANKYLRTGDVTPSGNEGGVAQVRTRINEALGRQYHMMQLPEWQETHRDAYRLYRLLQAMESRSINDLPLHDVDRVVEFRRAADRAYQAADNDGDRAIINVMRQQAADWLRAAPGKGGALKARNAKKTANLLQVADARTSEHMQRFQDNAVIRWMLAPVQGTRQQAGQLPTDIEVAQRLFGGGQSGLNFQSQDVDALRLIKGVVGPSSAEWQGLRQAGLIRLVSGLEQDLANNQTPRIITTANLIRNALTNQREAMQILYSPEEIQRLQRLTEVLQAMAPPAKSSINQAGSGIVAGRAMRRTAETLLAGLRRVPGANIAIGAVEDVADQARVSGELAGTRERNGIARRMAERLSRARLSPAIGAASPRAIPQPYQEEENIEDWGRGLDGRPRRVN